MRQAKTLFITLLSAILLACGGQDTEQKNGQETALSEAQGLWEYTGLVTSQGESLPLTGIFLITDGAFLQQSIFNGEPFAEQAAMAHAGPSWAGGAGLRLTAEQTLSFAPKEAQQLTSAGVTQHDLQVTRKDDELTLVFGAGSGTVQTFKRIGEAKDAKVYSFQNGKLGFAGDYFILVLGDQQSAFTGYGRYQQTGDTLNLDVIRWTQSDGTTSQNLRDVSLEASFDRKQLVLPGGERFSVLP